MEKFKFVIICKGSADSGYGHIRRSTALSEFIKDRGHHSSLIINPKPKDIGEKNNYIDDSTDIYILDLPEPDIYLYKKIRSTSAKIIGLDWKGTFSPDLTINIQNQENASKGKIHRYGFKYSIIRQEIINVKSYRVPKGVLVCIGGGDLLNKSVIASKFLCKNNQQVTLIKGPLINKEIKPDGFKVFSNPSNLAELMLSCEWAVANCGTTLFELMSLSKPVWVMPQTKSEDKLAKKLLKEKAILGIGDNISIPSLLEKEGTAKKASSIIDKNGTDRILMEAISLLK